MGDYITSEVFQGEIEITRNLYNIDNLWIHSRNSYACLRASLQQFINHKLILSYSSVEQNWKSQRWLFIYLHISSSKSNMLLFEHSDISKIITTNSDSWRLCFLSPIKVWIIFQKCNSWKNKMTKTSFQQAVQLKCLCKVIAYRKYLWWILVLQMMFCDSFYCNAKIYLFFVKHYHHTKKITSCSEDNDVLIQFLKRVTYKYFLKKWIFEFWFMQLNWVEYIKIWKYIGLINVELLSYSSTYWCMDSLVCFCCSRLFLACLKFAV